MEQSYGFPQTLLQYKPSTKNGVVTKFMANFCLCCIKKPFYQKWSCHKIYGKLLPVMQTKNKFSAKYGVVTKFMANFFLCCIKKIHGKYKIFLMAAYLIFLWPNIYYLMLESTLLLPKFMANISFFTWISNIEKSYIFW